MRNILHSDCIVVDGVSYSATGSGLFTTGVVGMAFTCLDKVTPMAEQIYESIKNTVEKLEASGTSRPGLLEQYKVMLERFTPEKGSPGCEFITFSGLMSTPSR